MPETIQSHIGYYPVYWRDEVNHCPGCGKTQWIVGRLTAECAFCATAMPITDAGMTGIGLFIARPRRPTQVALAA